MPKFHDPLTVAEGPVPATPNTGFSVVYVKTDGRIYFKDDAGVERQLTPIHVATTAPTSPAVGDLWVDTT